MGKGITFTKKECKHIAEWLDKDLMTELEKVMRNLEMYYKEAKNQKDKNEIKKLSKHNSKQALEIINMTKSIKDKIKKVY